MKKVITLIIFIFSVSLYANIDERLSDVYFANGIDTSEEQANDAKNALDKQTKKSNPEAYKSIANWKVSYNKTKGFQQDIYESAVQKIFTKLDESHSLSQYSGALV